MRLRTQIHRFIVSSALFSLFGAALLFQPTIEEQISNETFVTELPVEELPVVIVIDKTPSAAQSGSWRHMLPASLAPRRG